MSNLVRDNKVLVRKVLRDIKSGLVILRFGCMDVMLIHIFKQRFLK